MLKVKHIMKEKFYNYYKRMDLIMSKCNKNE